MKNISLVFTHVFLIISLTACTTKVLRPDLMESITTRPQLEDYHDRWILGFARKSYTDPKEACVNETAVKVRDYFSTEDFLLSLVTLGVYTPATTQVWCVSEKAKPE